MLTLRVPGLKQLLDETSAKQWAVRRPKMYDEQTYQLHVPVTNSSTVDADNTLPRDPKTIPTNDDNEPDESNRTEGIVTSMNAIHDMIQKPPPEGCIDEHRWLQDEAVADGDIAMICADPYELEKRAVMIWEDVIRCQKFGTCEISVGGEKFQPKGTTWAAKLSGVLETVAFSRQIALAFVNGGNIQAMVSAPVVYREKLVAKACGESYEPMSRALAGSPLHSAAKAALKQTRINTV